MEFFDVILTNMTMDKDYNICTGHSMVAFGILQPKTI